VLAAALCDRAALSRCCELVCVLGRAGLSMLVRSWGLAMNLGGAWGAKRYVLDQLMAWVGKGRGTCAGEARGAVVV
jgi:hypothetical protein